MSTITYRIKKYIMDQPIGRTFSERKMFADLDIKPAMSYYALNWLKDKSKITVEFVLGSANLITRISDIKLDSRSENTNHRSLIMVDVTSPAYKFAFSADSKMFDRSKIYSTVCGSQHDNH